MKALATLLVVMLVAVHLGFFALETFLYPTQPWFRDGLGFTDPVPPHEAVVIAQNQGLSNAFLAAGLALGLAWELRGKREGRAVLTFVLGCIAIAGLVGYATVRPPFPGTVGFLLLQTGLAVLALSLLAREP